MAAACDPAGAQGLRGAVAGCEEGTHVFDAAQLRDVSHALEVLGVCMDPLTPHRTSVLP